MGKGKGKGKEILHLKLSLVLPAYNEENIISKTLDEHLSWVPPEGVELLEILVVNDASFDRTAEILADFEAHNDLIQVITHPENCGKGAALQTGVAAARGDIIGCVDSDLAYPPSVYPDFIEAVKGDQAHLAIGNRYHSASDKLAEYPLVRRLASKAFRLVIRSLGISATSDTQCGIKFFAKGAASFLFARLKSPGFLYDLDILSMASILKLKIREVPVTMQLQAESNVQVHRQLLPVFQGLLKLLNRKVYRSHSASLEKAWKQHEKNS